MEKTHQPVISTGADESWLLRFTWQKESRFGRKQNFIAKHAEADVALRDWYKRTTKANWTNFSDIKQTFNTVDYINTLTLQTERTI